MITLFYYNQIDGTNHRFGYNVFAIAKNNIRLSKN